MEVLLTGATGFLGGFLLYDLLKETKSDVYCLVRAASADEARARLRNQLDACGPWDPGLLERACEALGKAPRDAYTPAMPELGTIRARCAQFAQEDAEAAAAAK